MALADTVRSFRQDADLEVCLAKCTIYMPGIQMERAHQLISECIEADASGTLRLMLAQCAQPRSNPGTWPLRRGHPSGRIPLRPGVRAKQVWQHVQGCRKDARRLCQPAHQVPTFEFLHEHVSVIPVMQYYSRQHDNML